MIHGFRYTTGMSELEQSVPAQNTDESFNELLIAKSFIAGNKELSLCIFSHGGAVTTISNINEEPVPGSTTAVYTQAHNTMQQTADLTGIAVSYQFITELPVMFAWANHSEKGKKIFAWDEVVEYDTGVVFTKTYFPQEIEV